MEFVTIRKALCDGCHDPQKDVAPRVARDLSKRREAIRDAIRACVPLRLATALDAWAGTNGEVAPNGGSDSPRPARRSPARIRYRIRTARATGNAARTKRYKRPISRRISRSRSSRPATTPATSRRRPACMPVSEPSSRLMLAAADIVLADGLLRPSGAAGHRTRARSVLRLGARSKREGSRSTSERDSAIRRARSERP